MATSHTITTRLNPFSSKPHFGFDYKPKFSTVLGFLGATGKKNLFPIRAMGSSASSPKPESTQGLSFSWVFIIYCRINVFFLSLLFLGNLVYSYFTFSGEFLSSSWFRVRVIFKNLWLMECSAYMMLSNWGFCLSWCSAYTHLIIHKIIFLFPCNTVGGSVDYKSVTDEEWRKRLTDEQFYITRKKGTERAFTGYIEYLFLQIVWSYLSCMLYFNCYTYI